MENPMVLVTGAAGFLGSNVVKRIRAQNAEVLPLVRSQYDLCHEAEASLAVLGARPTHIIHTAFHRGGPGPAFRNNMAMGMGVVHSAAVNHSRLVIPQIYYGALPWEADSQTDINAACDAQIAIEQMCEAYDRQYELDCALVRLPTLFGAASPRPDPVSLVATRVWQAALARAPECSLPFSPDDAFKLMYVGDAAEALARIAFSGAEGPCRVKPIAQVEMGVIIERAVTLTDYKGKVRLNEKPSFPMEDREEADDVHEVVLEHQTAVEVGLTELFKRMADRDLPPRQETPAASTSTPKKPGRSRPSRSRRPAAAGRK